MKLDLSQWRLQQDIDRIKILHLLHFIFLLLSVVYHNIQIGSWLVVMFGTPLFIGLYHLYYQTLKKLYYTYWSFSLFLLIYMLGSLVFADLSSAALYLRVVGLLFLGAQMWTLHDPIYYPIVSWWEYDFRFRDDIKIHAQLTSKDSKKVDGRLTDLRRKAACLTLFEDIDVGDEVIIESVDGLSFRNFRLKVMSKRQSSFGRPLNYGVKFLLGDAEESRDYEKFYDFWKNERQDKLRMKFQE